MIKSNQHRFVSNIWLNFDPIYSKLNKGECKLLLLNGQCWFSYRTDHDSGIGIYQLQLMLISDQAQKDLCGEKSIYLSCPGTMLYSHCTLFECVYQHCCSEPASLCYMQKQLQAILKPSFGCGLFSIHFFLEPSFENLKFTRTLLNDIEWQNHLCDLHSLNINNYYIYYM